MMMIIITTTIMIMKVITCHIMKCLWVEVLSASLLCSLLLHPGVICLHTREVYLRMYLYLCTGIYICMYFFTQVYMTWQLICICVFSYTYFFTLVLIIVFDYSIKLTSAVWPCLPKWWRNPNGNPETDSSWSLWEQNMKNNWFKKNKKKRMKNKSYIQGRRQGGQLHNVLCVVLQHIVHRKLGGLQN